VLIAGPAKAAMLSEKQMLKTKKQTKKQVITGKTKAANFKSKT